MLPGSKRDGGLRCEAVSQTQYLSYFPPFLKGGRGDFDSPIPNKYLNPPRSPFTKGGDRTWPHRICASISELRHSLFAPAHPDMDDGCNLYFICPLLLIHNSLGPRLQEPPRMGPTVTRRRRLEAAGNSMLVFLSWRSGAAITTVDQSDIRGLGTGLS